MRQVNAVHGSAVHSANLHVRSRSQAEDIRELRLELVGRTKQIGPTTDHENTAGEKSQRYKDKHSKPSDS